MALDVKRLEELKLEEGDRTCRWMIWLAVVQLLAYELSDINHSRIAISLGRHWHREHDLEDQSRCRSYGVR